MTAGNVPYLRKRGKEFDIFRYIYPFQPDETMFEMLCRIKNYVFAIQQMNLSYE